METDPAFIKGNTVDLLRSILTCFPVILNFPDVINKFGSALWYSPCTGPSTPVPDRTGCSGTSWAVGNPKTKHTHTWNKGEKTHVEHREQLWVRGCFHTNVFTATLSPHGPPPHSILNANFVFHSFLLRTKWMWQLVLVVSVCPELPDFYLSEL